MKRTTLLLMGVLAGCAGAKSAGPSKSLTHARSLQSEAKNSEAMTYAKAEIEDADRVLSAAEKEHAACAQCNAEKHLAAIAAEKYERAMASAQAKVADDRYAAMLRDKPPETQVVVRETEKQTVVTLPGEVFFATGESELLPQARDRLETLAEGLKQQSKEVEITIEGHADSVGSDSFNEALSIARAQSVKDYLVEKGIDAERINTIGRGERDPIATNKTPEGRANNRRVEIKMPGEA